MKKVIYAVLSFAPVLALAQNTTDLTGVSRLLANLGNVINRIIPLLFAVAVVYFFWGVVQFLRSSGDPIKHQAGKDHMIWGVIAIAVMASLFGLVGWLINTVGINTNVNIIPPVVNIPQP